jgi:anti-sigma B factor antagonist
VTLPLADVTFATDDGVVVASIRGEIDMSNAGEIGEAIGHQVSNEPHALVLDLSAVEYIDSAGIQVIYELHSKLSDRGQALRVVIAPGALIGEALRLTDVPRLVGASESVEAALTDVRES